MVTVQDLVESSTRVDLLSQAEDLGLEVKSVDGRPLNKTELAESILAAEAGLYEGDSPAEEDVLSASEGEEDVSEQGSETEVSQPDVQGVDDPDDSDDPDDNGASRQGEVLVRFTGKHPVLQTGGLTFKRSSPFRVMEEDTAQRVLDGPYGKFFRVATPREAKEFYS